MPFGLFSSDSKRGGLFKRKDLLGFIPELVVRSDIERHGHNLPPINERPLARLAVKAAQAEEERRLGTLTPVKYHDKYEDRYDKLFDRAREVYRGKHGEDGDLQGEDRYDSTDPGTEGDSEAYHRDTYGDDSYDRNLYDDYDKDLRLRRNYYYDRLLESLSPPPLRLQSLELSHFSFNRIAPRQILALTQTEHVSDSDPDDFKATIAESVAHRERPISGFGAPRLLTSSLKLETLFHLTNSRHPSPTIAEFVRQNAPARAHKLRVKPPHQQPPLDLQPPLSLPTEKLRPIAASLLVPYNGRLAPLLKRSLTSTLPPRSSHTRNMSSGTIHSVKSPALLSATVSAETPPLPQITSPSASLLSLGLKRFLKKFRLEKKMEGALALLQKYSHPGKLLGTGALGSVLLVTLKMDNHIYAVKKFRPRQGPQELVQDYRHKVEVEYRIGQQLRHENLIHTVELITDMPTKKMMLVNPHQEPDYYIVMEYCAYDFFTLVMLGLMSKQEVLCYFKQIVNGVQFLHGIGLAHRDLKLDNCVVNEYGQLKLIDFGLAVWFNEDHNGRVKFAKGIVGLDPYLAPEVFEYVDIGYDPRVADIWLVAIIYCCMILRRFPWKIPKQHDALYRSFSEGLSSWDIRLSDLESDDYDGGDNPRGAQRLLRLLPTEMRPLVKKMLTIDPERRYLIDEVADDPVFIRIEHCHNLSQLEYFIPNNHSHHLVTEDDLKK